MWEKRGETARDSSPEETGYACRRHAPDARSRFFPKTPNTDTQNPEIPPSSRRPPRPASSSEPARPVALTPAAATRSRRILQGLSRCTSRRLVGENGRLFGAFQHLQTLQGNRRLRSGLHSPHWKSWLASPRSRRVSASVPGQFAAASKHWPCLAGWGCPSNRSG